MLALNQIKTTKPKMNAVDNDCPRFRPFASPTHRIKVKKANYTTSLDPRGHIPGIIIKLKVIRMHFVLIALQYMNISSTDNR